MWYQHLGAASPVGPILCAIGLSALCAGGFLHGLLGWPTILSERPEAAARPPTFSERVSVHLIVFAVWAIGFGVIDWRGVPVNMIDTRFAFERRWPVVEWTEWIYFSVYFVPFTMPWFATRRDALRRFSLHLWWLLAISMLSFLIFPLGSPPRPFIPDTMPGRLLAWETSRMDFAAASLPSFHVFWGLLCARLLATRGVLGACIGWGWAISVAAACVSNGAHAVLDVAASGVIYAALAAFRPESRPIRKPTRAPSASPPSP